MNLTFFILTAMRILSAQQDLKKATCNEESSRHRNKLNTNKDRYAISLFIKYVVFIFKSLWCERNYAWALCVIGERQRVRWAGSAGDEEETGGFPPFFSSPIAHSACAIEKSGPKRPVSCTIANESNYFYEHFFSEGNLNSFVKKPIVYKSTLVYSKKESSGKEYSCHIIAILFIWWLIQTKTQLILCFAFVGVRGLRFSCVFFFLSVSVLHCICGSLSSWASHGWWKEYRLSSRRIANSSYWRTSVIRVKGF